MLRWVHRITPSSEIIHTNRYDWLGWFGFHPLTPWGRRGDIEESLGQTEMRPPLLVALLCVLPNIAAFGMDVRPVLGARPRSPPAALRRFPQRATVPRRGILRLAADKSVEADVAPEGEFERKMRDFLFNFGDRILDPFNAKSYLTGRSLIQSVEGAFVAGQKVAGQAVADGLVQAATVVAFQKTMIQFAAVVGFVIISVAPTVSTWMKSVLWVGAAVWAAWKQQK